MGNERSTPIFLDGFPKRLVFSRHCSWHWIRFCGLYHPNFVYNVGGFIIPILFLTQTERRADPKINSLGHSAKHESRLRWQGVRKNLNSSAVKHVCRSVVWIQVWCALNFNSGMPLPQQTYFEFYFSPHVKRLPEYHHFQTRPCCDLKQG